MRSEAMLPDDMAEMARGHFVKYYGFHGDELDEMVKVAGLTIKAFEPRLGSGEDRRALLHEMKGVFLNAGLTGLADLADKARVSGETFSRLETELKRIWG